MRIVWLTREMLYGVLLVFVVGVFFHQTFTYGRIPVPTDALVGLYHPWRDLYSPTNPRGVPFKNFLITDPIRQQIPWKKQAIEQLKLGRIPLWNPYNLLGSPMAANIQTGAYYPLNILFFLFDFPVAWTIFIVCELVLMALFLYLYLLNLRLAPLAAFIGALSWSYSGFAVAWLTWGTIVHVALWLPLLLLCIDKICANKSSRKLLLWATILAVGVLGSLLAGHAQISLYVMGISSGYVVWKLIIGSLSVRKTPWILLACAISSLIALPQWLPAMRFALNTSRIASTVAWQSEGWFLPVRHIVQFLVPDFFGNPTTMNYWGTWNYGEMIGYVGMIPFFFAVVALLASVHAHKKFFLIVLFISLTLMIDTPVSRFIFSQQIPMLSTMQPTRFMVLVDFSLAILVALGLDIWLKQEKYVPKRVLLFVWICMTAIWVGVMVGLQSGNEALAANFSIAKRNILLPTLILMAGTVLVCARGIFFKTNIKRVIPVFLAALVIFDLLRFGWKFTPFTPREYFFPTTKTIDFFRVQTQPFRVLTLDSRVFPPNTASYYGIEFVDGYDPLYLSDTYDFLRLVDSGKNSNENDVYRRIVTINNIDSRIFGLLNVRYVVSLDELDSVNFQKVFEEGETKVYEAIHTIPRAFAVDSVRVVYDESLAKDILVSSNFYPRKEAVVEEEIDVPPVATGKAEVVISSYEASRLQLRTKTDTKRLIVVTNILYPGWKATVDGTPVTLYKVDTLFQGVVVPAGEHIIDLHFSPSIL